LYLGDRLALMRQASSVQVRWELNWESIELCVVFWVSSCDVSPSVKWVKVLDPLFLDQYTLFLVGMYKTSSSTKKNRSFN